MLLSIYIYIYIYIWDDNWHGKAEVFEEKPVPVSLVHHIYPWNKGSNPYFRPESPEMWQWLWYTLYYTVWFPSCSWKGFFEQLVIAHMPLLLVVMATRTQKHSFKTVLGGPSSVATCERQLMNIKCASLRNRALLLVVTYSSADKWIYNTSHFRRFDSAWININVYAAKLSCKNQ